MCTCKIDYSKYFIIKLEVNSEIKSGNQHYALTTHNSMTMFLQSPGTRGEATYLCHCTINVKLAF